MSTLPRTDVVDFEAVRAAMYPKIEFQGVQKLYVKPLVNGSSGTTDVILEELSSEFTLWKAYRQEKQPPIIIFDPDGSFRPGNLAYSLTAADVAGVLSLDEFLEALPKEVRKELEGIRDMYGVPTDANHWQIIYRTMPSLRSPGQVRDVLARSRCTWADLVNQIVSFRGVKMDPRLRAIRRCHLLRGRSQAVNGHSIVCLPGGSGKSAFYELSGVKDEKVTANTTVGYADTDGIHPGSVHGTEFTFAMDQFESQGGWGIFRYLPSLMESGKARVDTAAQPFVVTSDATFVILANPGRSDPTKSFMVILEHLLREPAIGRRFGVILYDGACEPIERRLTRDEEERWKLLFEFFRAVEEASAPKVDQIYQDPEVWNWLNAKPYAWVAAMTDLLKPLEDDASDEAQGLRAFLLQFIENGQSHTRGAALAAAIASNLDRILLEDVSRAELLAQAEEILSELLDINEQSVRNIAKNLREEKKEGVRAYFDSRPQYLKEIIFAVLNLMKARKDAGQQSLKFNLLDVARNARDGTHFSDVVARARRANPERHNPDLKRRFGFELLREGKDLLVVIESYEQLSDISDISDMLSGEKTGVPNGDSRIDEGQPATEPEKREPGDTSPGVGFEPTKVDADKPMGAGEPGEGPSPHLSSAGKDNEALSGETPQPQGAPTPTPRAPAHLIVKRCSECGTELPFNEQYSWGKKDVCRIHFLRHTKERRESTNER